MMSQRFPKQYFLDQLYLCTQNNIDNVSEVTNAYYYFITQCKASSSRLVLIKCYANLYYPTYTYYAQCIYCTDVNATLGTAATLTLTSLSGGTFDASVQLLRSSDTKTVAFWSTTSNTLAGSCINLSGNTCTQSTIYTSLLSDVTPEYTIINITDTQFLIVWKNTSGVYYAATLTVSGNVITAGTSYALTVTSSTNYSSISLGQLSGTRYLVTAVNQTTSYRRMAFTVDISGTVITQNTPTYSTLAGVVPYYSGYNEAGWILGMGSHNKTIVVESDTKAYVVGISGTVGTSGYNRYVPITISGTTTTVGAVVTAFGGGPATRFGFTADGFGDGTWLYITGDVDLTYYGCTALYAKTSRNTMANQKSQSFGFYDTPAGVNAIYATSFGVTCLNTRLAYVTTSGFYQNGGLQYYGIFGRMIRRQ